MILLHTSDLHLGKNLLEESFYEEQKYILNQIIHIVKENNVDTIMIPGDIYDKSIPSAEAIMLFDNFLVSLSKLNVEILITSGNHDSNDRLAYGSNIFNQLNIHIVTNYDGNIYKISKKDVDFYLLPFIRPFHLKKLMTDEEYANIKTSNDMMKWILSRETIDKSKKNILLTHQFVMWNGLLPKTSDSESISINNLGTLDAIDANILDEFDYVALGHIHRPQKIKRETIRYSGTPLKYSFSEVNDEKSVVLIDTNKIEDFKLIPLIPKRNINVLRGTFEEIMNMPSSEDIIKVELTDENILLSPMEEIRKRFPNAISLAFVDKKVKNTNSEEIEITNDMSPTSLFNEFFKVQNDRELSSEEKKYLKDLIDEMRGEEKCD